MDKCFPNLIPQHISSPLSSYSNRQSEHITALESQLQLYANDFQSKHLNREEAPSRAAQLKQELNTPFYTRTFNGSTLECDSEKVTKDIDFVDSLTPICVTEGKGQLVVDKEKKLPIIEDNILKCHKCNSGWNVDDHKKFLKHIDTCVPKN